MKAVTVGLLSALSWQIGCATAPAAEPAKTVVAAPEQSAVSPAPAAQSAPPTSPAAASAQSASAPDCSSAAKLPLDPRVLRILSEAVTDLAYGKGTTAAVRHGLQVKLHEQGKWKALPDLPARLHGQTFELFFGRDNQPRIMGSTRDAEPTSIYLRFKQARWQPEPSELGRLGKPQGALFGVLGYADPEVVCRPGDVCLIKRLSGWKSVPSPTAPLKVVLSGKDAWALASDHLQQLQAQGFVRYQPEQRFSEPSSVSGDPTTGLWVTDATPSKVFRLEAGAWRELSTPLPRARAVHARSATDVYVVGDQGAAHFDGKSFSCLAGVPGPLHTLLEVGGELWLAGDAGVFAVAKTRR